MTHWISTRFHHANALSVTYFPSHCAFLVHLRLWLGSFVAHFTSLNPLLSGDAHSFSHSRRAREDNLQCLVISLKDSFYEKADALVGVFKDKATQRSGTLTLDLTQYDDPVADE